MKTQIGKARVILLQYKNIWNSTKLSEFATQASTVLFHEIETWRNTTISLKNIQVFIKFSTQDTPRIMAGDR